MSDKQLQAILDSINKLEERVNERFDKIETNIVEMKHFMQGLASRLDSVETRLGNLEATALRIE